MKLLKEPLLHFLLLGALIFAIHAWRQDGAVDVSADSGKRIDVNAATITRLREGWTRQFQRTPNADDMRELVEAHIREEVLCREALAMGLDRDDTIVRRRMAQKMEFLTQDISTAVAPDEASLAKFFADNSERYAKPAQVSFRHVYFSREKRGAKLEADASEALRALAQPGVSDEAFGDPFLQGFEFNEQGEQDLSSIFGREFAASVMKAPTASWSGPITSSYGVHLVHVKRRGESQPVEMAVVREAVMRDFLDERRRVANDNVLVRMRQNYEVVIDEAALNAAAIDPAKTAQTPQ
jgi:parvulin-like peptidyl-prolyl isomerase